MESNERDLEIFQGGTDNASWKLCFSIQFYRKHVQCYETILAKPNKEQLQKMTHRNIVLEKISESNFVGAFQLTMNV